MAVSWPSLRLCEPFLESSVIIGTVLEVINYILVDGILKKKKKKEKKERI